MENTKILVVDDEPNFRDMTCDILRLKKYEVGEAENGNTAVEMVKNDSFDVVLLDLKLPDIDGIEVMKKIREFDEKIIIIMITGCPSLETSMEASKLNVYDYLVKPVETRKLIQIIERASKEKKIAG